MTERLDTFVTLADPLRTELTDEIGECKLV